MSFLFKQIVTRCFRKNKSPGVTQSQKLTELEKKILKEISLGKSYTTIAEELSINKNSVQKYVRVIYEKLQQKSTTKNP